MPDDARVLVVAPFRRDADALLRSFDDMNIAGEACLTPETLPLQLDGASVLVLTQEALSPGITDILTVELEQQHPWSELPVIVLLNPDRQREGTYRKLRRLLPRSKLTVLQRPIRRLEFVTMIQMALSARERQLKVRDYVVWQEELRRELNHRVKNVLANVYAIYHMTKARGGDLEEFSQTFEGRLSALTSVNSMLSLSNEARSLADIAEAVLAPYSSGTGQIETSGPKILLAPGKAIALALCLHELATNAAKYGALSQPGGRIRLSWDHGGESGAVIRWEESGGPTVREPLRRGYGTRFISAAIKSQRGQADFAFDPGGLVCTVELPVGVATQDGAEASACAS